MKILSVPLITLCLCVCTTVTSLAQSPSPYPRAVTDRSIRLQTPMTSPPVNTPFKDPDFGSMMVRATDTTTNFKLPGSYLRNEGSGQANMWSSDTRKFYVVGAGGYEFAFGFNPATMKITSLPKASPEKALLLPLRPGSTFSFTDPDLLYGTKSKTPLSISGYRFSTGVSTTVIDTTTCGTIPKLVFTAGSVVSDDSVSLSGDDKRISISEGGPQSGKHPFVVVYDKALGCRWYNTQRGQIGGQWGMTGKANADAKFLVRHAYLSRNGKYIKILVNHSGWYLWELSTLKVVHCSLSGNLHCGGYGVVGYNSVVNALGYLEGMNIGKRPLDNLSEITSLVDPAVSPGYFEQEKHFTWSNAYRNDRVPVCVSTYNYEGETTITKPFDGEIFCIKTDGIASTVWRFAHNRAIWVDPYFNTQPLGNVSRNGRFFLFTSGWDGQLGVDRNGVPRSDVWIVKLE